jgi:hypothetical protein
MIIPGILHFHALEEKPDEAARATAICAAAVARNSSRVSLGLDDGREVELRIAYQNKHRIFEHRNRRRIS